MSGELSRIQPGMRVQTVQIVSFTLDLGPAPLRGDEVSITPPAVFQ